MTKGGWLLSLVVLSSACGSNPGGDDPAEPIARLTGSLTGDLGGAEADSPFLGILWVNKEADDEASLLDVADVAPVELPGSFEFPIFDAPAPDRVSAIEDDSGRAVGELAMGWLVALDDGDADGTFTRVGWELQGDDRYLGVAWLHHVIWVGSQPPADELPYITNAELLTPGFHVLRTVCGPEPDVFEVADPASPVEIRLFDPIVALEETTLDDDFGP